MPIRTGIDLVSVESVRESISEHGGRYLERVYSAREVSDCSTPAGVDAQRLAGARVISNCSPYLPRKVSGGPFGAAGVTIGIWRWERK